MGRADTAWARGYLGEHHVAKQELASWAAGRPAAAELHAALGAAGTAPFATRAAVDASRVRLDELVEPAACPCTGGGGPSAADVRARVQQLGWTAAEMAAHYDQFATAGQLAGYESALPVTREALDEMLLGYVPAETCAAGAAALAAAPLPGRRASAAVLAEHPSLRCRPAGGGGGLGCATGGAARRTLLQADGYTEPLPAGLSCSGWRAAERDGGRVARLHYACGPDEAALLGAAAAEAAYDARLGSAGTGGADAGSPDVVDVPGPGGTIPVGAGVRAYTASGDSRVYAEGYHSLAGDVLNDRIQRIEVAAGCRVRAFEHYRAGMVGDLGGGGAQNKTYEGGDWYSEKKAGTDSHGGLFKKDDVSSLRVYCGTTFPAAQGLTCRVKGEPCNGNELECCNTGTCSAAGKCSS